MPRQVNSHEVAAHMVGDCSLEKTSDKSGTDTELC
jgi:hypothetical protein